MDGVPVVESLGAEHGIALVFAPMDEVVAVEEVTPIPRLSGRRLGCVTGIKEQVAVVGTVDAQEIELGGRQPHRPAGHAHLAPLVVDGPVPGHERFGFRDTKNPTLEWRRD